MIVVVVRARSCAASDFACLGHGGSGFLDLDLVSKRFADGSYFMGWLVLFRCEGGCLFRWGGGCLLGCFSFGDSLCFTGPCSSSLALGTTFLLFRCVGCLEGACPVVFEPFPCDWLAVCTNRISCLSSYILCAGVRWAGHFCFEIGSWCLAAILFDLIWCSLVYRGRGVPCWFSSKVWWADHFWFEIESQLFRSS